MTKEAGFLVRQVAIDSMRHCFMNLTPNGSPALLATSVTGLWSRDEITASYTPSAATFFFAIVAPALVFILVALWRGREKKMVLAGLGVAVGFSCAYFFLVQKLAGSLCIDSPLFVKVHGILRIPFFLGTTGAGLAILATLFMVVSYIVMKLWASHAKRQMLLIFFNTMLALILITLAIVARWATNTNLRINL